jgi:hypothetical protein
MSPVPPGFTISTEVCGQAATSIGNSLPAKVEKEVQGAIAFVEEMSRKRFGDPSCPLLLSVRSGAAVWMRMMDTVLLQTSSKFYPLCIFIRGITVDDDDDEAREDINLYFFPDDRYPSTYYPFCFSTPCESRHSFGWIAQY